MNIKKITSKSSSYPAILRQLASPPKQLYVQGQPLNDLLQLPRVAVIGSRSITPYGKQVTEELSAGLAKQGIVVISGLALGVDSVAHRSALENNGRCIAVLPSCLQRIVPRTNLALAHHILDKQGTLVSEYAESQTTYKQNFVARNRIMAGLADAVLITEAGLKSGTMHTARFALEQGIAVMAVPGSIYNSSSQGTNSLIKAGASVVTEIGDILAVLGLRPKNIQQRKPIGSNLQQQIVLDLLASGCNDGDELLRLCKLPINDFNKVITMLEITSKIRSLGGNHWTIS